MNIETLPVTGARKGKITELEGIRGLLAWWVIASHCFLLAGIKTVPLPLRPLLQGNLAVDVFVILSGFVIFMLLDKGGISYPAFLIRRFFRLFPTYVICLMAMLPIIGYAVAAISGLPWANNDPTLAWIVSDWAVTKAHLGEQILVHLTMLHGLLPNEVLPDSAAGILGPAWSISLEWQFYLVAPALLWITRRSMWGRCAIFALIILSYLAAPKFGGMFDKGRFLTYPLPGFLPLKAQFFFIGACSYYLYDYTRRHGPPAQAGAWALPLLVFIIIFTRSIPLIIWCLVLGSHILRVAGQQSPGTPAVAAILNSRFFQWTGRISYSTYMCHVPILYCVMLAMVRFKHTWSHLEFMAVLVAVSSPAILLCSHVLFACVENPFIVMSKKWTSTRRNASPEISGVSLMPDIASD